MDQAPPKSLPGVRQLIRYILLNKAVRILIPAFASIFLYGSITYAINYQSPTVWNSVLIEAIRVFLLTLLGTTLLEGFYFRFLRMSIVKTPGLAAITCTGLLNFSVALIMHYLAGTENILTTALAGQMVGLSYASFYIFGLKKLFPTNPNTQQGK